MCHFCNFSFACKSSFRREKNQETAQKTEKQIVFIYFFDHFGLIQSKTAFFLRLLLHLLRVDFFLGRIRLLGYAVPASRTIIIFHPVSLFSSISGSTFFGSFHPPFHTNSLFFAHLPQFHFHVCVVAFVRSLIHLAHTYFVSSSLLSK